MKCRDCESVILQECKEIVMIWYCGNRKCRLFNKVYALEPVYSYQDRGKLAEDFPVEKEKKDGDKK